MNAEISSSVLIAAEVAQPTPSLETRTYSVTETARVLGVSLPAVSAAECPREWALVSDQRPATSNPFMNSLLDNHREELADACRRFDVEILEVFGSVARQDFDFEKSDVDFIVRFRNPGSPGYADRYLGLAENLERILGRPVDILTQRSLRNPLFIEQITPDRTVVYAA